ncbi:ATP-binding cassette, subfamily B [Sporobacter termitidis DSM 10068]|uniref:ATP-binding cassette, subfamily B n=1 Tax=Sporobacter termitidis DSM 10068 TaxID=1123282 RepID=A0A1M5UQP0_9FIRM|nr:ABC transporter ATP-binding protein [Sporobacter termitidis]SHH65224.1 ATP-binding cassette, subfamily B [Sporobacter termitidis DSM 10068]
MKKTKHELFHMLTGFAKGSKRYFAVAVLATALSILFSFLMPQVVGFTVDSVIGTKSAALPGFLMALFERAGGRDYLRANFIVCALGVVLCACLSGIFNYFSRMGTARGTEGFVKRLRDTLFTHTQYLPFSWHTENQTGDIIQRCTYDVDTAQRFISQQLIEVVRTLLLVALALGIMFSMNVLLAVIALCFIPLILGYSGFFFSRIADKFEEADEAEGELMIHVQENLTGVRVVRAFGRERYETDRFDEKNEAYVGKWLTLGKILGYFWGIGDIVSSGELLVMVTVGAALAAHGTITLGEYLVFISYTVTMAWPVRQLGHIISEMSKTGVSLRRIKEILDAPVEEEEPGALEPPLDRDIVFDHVSFAYGAQSVLTDLNFTVKKGTTFGILGTTGSGKSTVTYLLNRLYDLPEGGGSIKIGDVDVRKIDRHHLRRHIGLVLQEPFLFSKTIFENIDIAARRRDLSRARGAAAIAAVDDSILSFSNGYDTVVGERGVTLSGGQKQRIAIARTLMLDAPIMVFDDSMSSLDMETDAKIRASLRANTGDATVLLISHRISTLMQADKIMVLENGRIAELGSHAELLEKNGVYKRVYDLQSGT